MRYNAVVAALPINLIASLFKFRPATMFTTRDAGGVPG